MRPHEIVFRRRWVALSDGQRGAISAQIEATRTAVRLRKWSLTTERCYCGWVAALRGLLYHTGMRISDVLNLRVQDNADIRVWVRLRALDPGTGGPLEIWTQMASEYAAKLELPNIASQTRPAEPLKP